MKLFDCHGSFRGRKIRVVAQYLELPLEIHNLKTSALKEKEFLKKNPFGRVPVLESTDGLIYESNAIIRYLARSRKELALYGSSLYEEGLVDQWLETCSLEIEPSILALVLPILGWAPVVGDRERIWSDINRNLDILNVHLKFKTFLVGNRVSLADISIASILSLGYLYLFEEKVRENYVNLTRWFSLINDQKPFTNVFGKVKFCEKEFPPSNLDLVVDLKPTKEEKNAKKEEKDNKKAEKNTKKAEKKEGVENKTGAKEIQALKQQKKEEKKTEKPTIKPQNEEEDDDKAFTKQKNPLDILPPSTFNFYDFKTLFVNAIDKKEALKFFWDNFDPKGYSIWFVKYVKAEGEGKNLIFTNNLMGGFLNRLEDFRRYSFAVHGVYGEEPNLEIRGCWVWRGLEHPQEIKDLPNYEFHTIERCDLNKTEHKNLVEQYWTSLNEGDVVEGLKAQTVKYFK